MRVVVSCCLALATLGACAVAGTAPPKRPGASAAPGSGRASKAPATAAPDTPRPSAVAASFAPVASSMLSGLVTLDASYMVAAGAGNVISGSGGQIVAAGAGNLVGPDGASLIGADGGSLIGADGASLVGPDGASLVGPDGASLVGPDAASYRLTELAASPFMPPALHLSLATPPPPPPGTRLPASRMRVRIYNLETGEPVLASRDPAARADAFVLTDAQGRYQAPVLADSAGNVLVVADVIGKPDARLRLDEIARPQAEGATAALDEDLAIVTNYLRLVLYQRLRDYISRADSVSDDISFGKSTVSEAEQALAEQIFGEIMREARLARVPALPSEHLDRLVVRMGDVVLAHMPVKTLPINASWTKDTFVMPAGWGPEHPAHEVLRDTIQKVNAAAAQRMGQGPLVLEGSSIDPLVPVVRFGPLRKPADAGQFLVTHYVTPTAGGQFDLSAECFEQLGLPITMRYELKVALDGFLMWAMVQLATDAPLAGEPSGPGMRARFVSMIRESATLAPAAIPAPDTGTGR